jgi:sulfatase maturation enzyme AslB (radical SAM superfamily)
MSAANSVLTKKPYEAMKGLRVLKAHDIPFHVISVITQQALGRAEDIYHFFYDPEVFSARF